MLPNSRQIRIWKNSDIDDKLIYWKCLQFNFDVLNTKRSDGEEIKSSSTIKNYSNRFSESSEFNNDSNESNQIEESKHGEYHLINT